MRSIRTVILGGGRGTRLFPLTKDRAKPSVPIAGKFRLVDIPVSNCLNSDLGDVSILTQFNSTSLIRHVADTYHSGGLSARGVHILAASQTLDNSDWFQGTADAVRQNLRHLIPAHDPPEHLLILAGDHLYRMDYRAMIAAHLENRADITVAVLPVARADASRFGILRADERGRVVRFVEKPSDDRQLDDLLSGDDRFPGAPPALLASMGIYLFRTPVLHDQVSEPAHIDFGQHILPGCIDTHHVQAYRFDGYWADIGTIKAFYEANLGLVETVPRFDFYNESAPIYTLDHHLADTKINESYIRQGVLAEGSIIDRSEIIHSIVGLRCTVGAGTRIEDSVIMGADYYESAEEIAANAALGIPRIGIGRHCRLRGVIIDKNAHIGDDVELTNRQGVSDADGDNYYIRDHILVVPRGAVIRAGTSI